MQLLEESDMAGIFGNGFAKIVLVFLLLAGVVGADDKAISVADIAPGDATFGEPALILQKDGMVFTRFMPNGNQKTIGFLENIKQIDRLSALDNNGAIYRLNGSLGDIKRLFAIKFSDKNFKVIAESPFGNGLAMSAKDGDVFYFPTRPFVHLDKNASGVIDYADIASAYPIQKVMNVGSAVTALAISGAYDVVTGRSMDTDFDKSIIIVAARQDKSVELGMKRIIPKVEASDFSVCKLPDTPEVVNKIFIAENGVLALLESGKIAYTGFECLKDGNKTLTWQYHKIGTTEYFLDIYDGGVAYAALGQNGKIYMCNGGLEGYGLVPSKQQNIQNLFDHCLTMVTPIKHATRIRYNAFELYLLDMNGNAYFWNYVSNDPDYKRAPIKIDFFKK